MQHKEQISNGGKSTIQMIQQQPNQIVIQQHRKQQKIQTTKITPQKSAVKYVAAQRVTKPRGKRKISCRRQISLADHTCVVSTIFSSLDNSDMLNTDLTKSLYVFLIFSTSLSKFFI